MVSNQQKKKEKIQKRIIYVIAAFVAATFGLFGYFSFAANENQTGDAVTSLATLFMFLGLVGAFAFLGFALYVKASKERYRKEHQDDYIFRS